MNGGEGNKFNLVLILKVWSRALVIHVCDHTYFVRLRSGGLRLEANLGK
jgi:hypothetical protein